MHSFLRSIGFSKILTRVDLESLLIQCVTSAGSKKVYKREEGVSFIEYNIEFADDIGIIIRGEEDSEGIFHYEHFCPYVRNMEESSNEEIYVNKSIDSEEYFGMCDDIRLGVSVIFYILNVIDFVRYQDEHKDFDCLPVYYSALAQSGKILLPTESKETKDYGSGSSVERNRNKLIEEIKKGSKEALESLTIEEIDVYTMINNRIKSEDLFSIVDTSLVPYGAESYIYSILGNIVECDQRTNSKTGEKLWVLKLKSNDIFINTCINEKDLVGEPAVGRRFKGIIWLQGSVVNAFD